MNSLRATLAHPQFHAGFRSMAAASLGTAAWGLVTGVAMVESGLSIPLALAMSLLVYAGSAQLAALPLMASGAPLWVIWAAALCVNLRFVIFSAHWRPFFMHLPRARRMALGFFTADLSYVMFMRRFAEPRQGEGQIEYFLGASSLNWLGWQVPSIAGILLADVVPTEWGLGFAGVLALLGLLCSMLSDHATRLAAVVAAAAAVAAFSLPFKLHIVVAIAAAVCVGLLSEGGGDAGRRLRAALVKPARLRPRDDLRRRSANA